MHRLSLHTLKGIDQQNGPFASSQAAGDLVIEIDVAWSIDQVQFIAGAVVIVEDGDRVHLDGDAPFLLQVHRIEHLVVEIPHTDGIALQQKLVCERALTMINVGDDAELRIRFGGVIGLVVARPS